MTTDQKSTGAMLKVIFNFVWRAMTTHMKTAAFAGIFTLGLMLTAGLAACDEDTTADAAPDGGARGDAASGETSTTTPDASTSSDATSTPDAPVSSCGLVVPQAYDGASFAANITEELGLRTKLTAFLQPMKDAEANLANQPTAASLKALFEDGTPSLKSITSAYHAGRIEGWLTDFEAAAGDSWSPAVNPDGGMPVGPGGKYGNWIFHSTGTDIRQGIEKGMYASAHYNRAHALLTAGTITEATLDRVLALYGSNPTFPLNDKTGDGGVADPDLYSAVYAKRREANDASNPGVYLRIKRAFITAQAAIRRGAECNADRDAAIATIKADWEKALLATVIYYLNDASKKLGAAAPTAADLAAGLHGYGEAIAFVHGFRQLPTNARVITDAQIDDILTTINAPPGAPATSYKLVTDTALELPKLAQGITKVAAVYSFSQADIDAFKVNR
jgi:hypothetical protein